MTEIRVVALPTSPTLSSFDVAILELAPGGAMHGFSYHSYLCVSVLPAVRPTMAQQQGVDFDAYIIEGLSDVGCRNLEIGLGKENM